MGWLERICDWWRGHRPAGGTIATVARDLHRDPLIRLKGHRDA